MGSNCGRALAAKGLHCFQEQPTEAGGSDGIRFSVLENQSAGTAERKKGQQRETVGRRWAKPRRENQEMKRHLGKGASLTM